MYTRSYNDSSGDRPLPESYSGVALNGGFIRESVESDEISEPTSATPGGEEKAAPTFLGGILSGILHKTGIERIGERLPFLERIGTEEILIIIAALILFFSKEGDKECAIALMILLFIT